MNFFKRKNTVSDVRSQLNKLEAQSKEASKFISELQRGNVDISISKHLLASELGASLLSIKKHLADIAKEEKERNWYNTGLAMFSDILRNKDSLTLQELADDTLSHLVKYVNANQGAIFILEESDNKEQHLHLLSCYAYERKKFLEKKIALGQGLAGQCALEKEIMYLTEAPANYLTITSGLGQAVPRTVLISPLLINDRVFGVMELASFDVFHQHKIDFIKKLSENIAASIKNTKDNARTVSLLNASQQQAEELLAQEEEMRQNMEELQATQEEMQRKSNELNKASVEMSGIIAGINATMATIEFKPDGTIITANSNFLKSMKYSLEEIQGKHHRQFVPKEIQESDEYKTFWKRLGSGESITGIFKRLSSSGDTVWLNAIYNPIFDATGKVIKVIKFATDITAEQEALAESKGILSGINATMAIIEFKPDGTIITANSNFLKSMKYSLEEIQGKHHRQFVPKEIQDSDEYKTFWRKLGSGESITGIFERLSSAGDTVWLNAIYNPIFNANGKVTKIVKFATDVTKSKHEN